MEQIRILNPNVPRTDVARGYLAVELQNTLGHDLQGSRGDIGQSLGALDEHQVFRLLEAVSYTYRMNGAFHVISDQSYDWQQVEIPLDSVRMTAMNPGLNEVIFSEEVQRSPAKMAGFILKNQDIRQYDELRPRDAVLPSSNLIVVEKSDGLDIMDGNHRVVVAAALGVSSVRAFMGVRNGSESKHMVGDSVFLTLRLQYEKLPDGPERQAILTTCESLAGSSTDGVQALQRYWVDNAQFADTVSAGQRMLSIFTV